MESMRRNMFYDNKKQETTEIGEAFESVWYCETGGGKILRGGNFEAHRASVIDVAWDSCTSITYIHSSTIRSLTADDGVQALIHVRKEQQAGDKERDFHLFAKLKEFLGGKRFTNDEEYMAVRGTTGGMLFNVFLVAILASFLGVGHSATTDSPLDSERKHLAKVFRMVVSNLGKCDRCSVDEGRMSALLKEAVKRNILDGLGLESPPVLREPLPPLPTPASLHLHTASYLPLPPEIEKKLVLATATGCTDGNDEYRMSLEVPTSLQASDLVSAKLWIHSAADTPSADGCQLTYSSCDQATNPRRITAHVCHSTSRENRDHNFLYGHHDFEFFGTWRAGYCSLGCSVTPRLRLQRLGRDGFHLDGKIVAGGSGTVPKHRLQMSFPFRPAGLPVVSRKKRHYDCKLGSADCCRENLMINFTEIGWGAWLIRPETLNVHYCKGPCSKATTLSSSSFYATAIEVSIL
ncbi:hypothetical protein AAG570_012734 [Ranatra chinensis]|uniref:TGF-beta family profile domain-containing protein n=1 Tax=Ranatra chinensis TaxID=642074 RepID=A0ABD0YEU7_9HEMI